MKKCFYLLPFVCLLMACTSPDKHTGKNVLSASLKETEISLKELFNKIEVIPLETNDTALMDHVLQIREVNGNYYILNEDYPGFQYINILVFDAKGDFSHTIGKKGQGPKEYPWMIYDMDIDTEKNLAYMMSPAGIFYLYQLDGSFVRKTGTQTEAIYHGIQLLDTGRILSWSGSADIEDDALRIMDVDSAQTIKGLWKDHNNLNWAISAGFSYKFQNKIYFTPSIERNVYEVVSDSLQIAYTWDFGEDNYDASDVRSQLDGLTHVDKEEHWTEMRKTGAVPYTLLRQGQTNRYYFTNILGVLGEYDDKGYAKNYFSLLYDKETSKSYYFKKTTEGFAIRPDMFTEDAICQLVSTEDLNLLLPVLNETEKAKVMKRIEDDNPCLLKFYFK